MEVDQRMEKRMKIDLREIQQALETVKRLSSLTYGRYALGGDERVADDLATLYRLAVSGIALCDAVHDRERVTQ